VFPAPPVPKGPPYLLLILLNFQLNQNILTDPEPPPPAEVIVENIESVPDAPLPPEVVLLFHLLLL
jgi:hypothetical protein